MHSGTKVGQTRHCRSTDIVAGSGRRHITPSGFYISRIDREWQTANTHPNKRAVKFTSCRLYGGYIGLICRSGFPLHFILRWTYCVADFFQFSCFDQDTCKRDWFTNLVRTCCTNSAGNSIFNSFYISKQKHVMQNFKVLYSRSFPTSLGLPPHLSQKSTFYY